MWLDLLIILGTCVAGVLLGFSVYWIIANSKRKLRANQISPRRWGRQTPLTITEDIDQSLEQPFNEAYYAPDIQRETDTEKEDYDWLNNGLSEVSASAIQEEDDDWLNAGIEKGPANVYIQPDDDWINAENNQPLDIMGESTLNRAGDNSPEIQINQDESILNITITASKKGEIKSEQTVINLKINIYPQGSAKKGEGPDGIEITTDAPSPSNPSLQDIISVKPGAEPVNPSQPLMDEISIRPVETPDIESHAPVDEITFRPVNNPGIISPQPQNEMNTGPVETRGLMDEIIVRPAETPVIVSPQLIDEIYIGPVENQVTESHGLMDEICPKPSPGPINIEYELLDDLITKGAIYRTKKAKYSGDVVITNTVEGPIEKAEPPSNAVITGPMEGAVEKAEPFSDAVLIYPVEGYIEKAEPPSDTVIITNTVEGLAEKVGPLSDTDITNPVEGPAEKVEPPSEAVIITNPVEGPAEKAEPPSDTVIITNTVEGLAEKVGPLSDTDITNPVEAPVEKAEPIETISVDEITEILNEERDFKQAAVPSATTELRSTPFLDRVAEGTGNLSSRPEGLYKKSGLREAMTKALAALRIYNNNGFYIQETNLAHLDILMQKPEIKDFTFQVLNTTDELDELIDGGYDLVMNFSKIKRGLKKGMVIFLLFVNRELASMGWACITEESKSTFRGYPYNDDLDRQACIVGDWTNPKFLDSSISNYVKYKRQQLLKEKGFTFERSIVEDSMAKDLRSISTQKGYEITYKRRTYTNISLPGILGLEFWQEHPVNGIDTEPPYKMITLLVLVLPSTPMLASLNIKPRVLKLNWI